MGIIKNKNELLPVTCAVLKDPDRKAFFSSIQGMPGGVRDQLARLLGVSSAVVADWIGGKALIPYHTLQRIAHEFKLEIPPVMELRRESLPVDQIGTTAPLRSTATRTAKPSATPKPALRQRSRRSKDRSSSKQQVRPERPRKSTMSAETGKPRELAPAFKYSSDLAYWIGTILAAAKLENDHLLFAADRRIGQNFAAIWARHTWKVLGIKPRLAMQQDNQLQEASIPLGQVKEWLNRSGLPIDRPAIVPRWIWSNPDWKTACLKGLMDTAGRFQRTPSLSLEMRPELCRAAHKILGSLSFRPQFHGETSVILEGQEQIEKYLTIVGTKNPKLCDQLKNYFSRLTASPPPDRDPKESCRIPGHEGESPRPIRPKRTVFRGQPKRQPGM